MKKAIIIMLYYCKIKKFLKVMSLNAMNKNTIYDM